MGCIQHCHIIGCEDCCGVVWTNCTAKDQFDSNRSSTYKLNGTEWSHTYNYIHGFRGEDTIQLSKELSIPGASFVQVDDVPTGWLIHEELVDGVLGLGFPRRDTADQTPSIFQTAVERGDIDTTFFTVWADLFPWPGHPNGQITFGEWDLLNCAEEGVQYFDVNTAYSGWAFEVNTMSVNGKQFDDDTRLISVDTSIVPIDIFHHLVYKPFLKAVGAKYNVEHKAYEVDLSKPLIWSLKNGDSELTFDVRAFTRETDDGTALLLIQDNYDRDRDVILGSSALAHWCAVFDVAKKQIGFTLKY